VSYELRTSKSKILGKGLKFGKSSGSRKIPRGQWMEAIVDRGMLPEAVPN